MKISSNIMLQQTITLILAVAGVLAAAGCLWASWNAHRSALTAQEVARHAEKIERRGLLRELIVTAHRVIAESSQMALLVEDLKAEYRVLASFSGQTGGYRERLLIRRAESKQTELSSLREEAQSLVQRRTELFNASEEELTQALLKFDGFLVQVLRIKDTVEREIAAVAGDNRLHRGRHLKALSVST
jgi:cell division septum initiation protein DivIVA